MTTGTEKAQSKKTDQESESESDAAAETDQACSMQKSIAYPANLTVANLLQFIAIPTLCYQVNTHSCFQTTAERGCAQLNYPQAKGIRRMWLFKRVLELLSCLAVMVFLVIVSLFVFASAF